MTDAQIAHNARNAARRAEAQQRKMDRFLAHVERNNAATVDAWDRRAKRIADHEARNEAAALASATQAFAEMVEQVYGIPANDNCARLKAA